MASTQITKLMRLTVSLVDEVPLVDFWRTNASKADTLCNLIIMTTTLINIIINVIIIIIR